MMGRLHPDLAVAGVLFGAVAVWIGHRWPDRRGKTLPFVVAESLLVATIASPSDTAGRVVAVVAVLAAAGMAIDEYFEGRAEPRVPAWWFPVLALPAVGVAYLSVPDTEGAVSIGAALAALSAGVWHRGWRLPVLTSRLWILTMAASVVGVAWMGANGRFSIEGWWVAKVVLVLIEIALVMLVVRDARAVTTSAPAHPPR